MFKKFLFYLIIILSIIPTLVNASDTYEAKIEDNYYTNLKDAIANATSEDIIVLTSNEILDETLNINKTVNIDLNGKTISAPSKVFQVQGGTLNLTGEGTIKETNPNYGAIMVIGSTEPTDTSYSIVNVGENVKLEGWSGIFITHNEKKSYGVKINLNGKVNAINDINGDKGAGIYTNGNIKDKTNSPIINISDTAKITSTGNGLYLAGYSTVNIGKAYISGIESAIGIKSGILNINGANIICTGEDKTPTTGYNNGIKASGTTIQIESNTGYAGDIELNIKSGNLTSKHSNVIYEYIGKGTTTKVKSINLSGGNYLSEDNKEVFLLSNPFKTNHPKFITGGTYSSNPNEYLKQDYTTTLDNDSYTVIKSTMKEVIFNTINTKTSPIKPLIIIIVTIIVCFLIYLNKQKVFNKISK